MSGGPEWFAPRRYGYGAGLPIAWQGWALSLGFGAVLLVATFALRNSMLAMLSVIIPSTVALLIISARTTRGGWRWRWGDDD